MFTGIVEEVGRILSVQRRAQSAVLSIRGPKVTSDVAIGDSIAVNGVCLTVTSLRGDTFTADVSAETLRRTTLDRATSGTYVNLERAMRMGDRFGGHIVQGSRRCGRHRAQHRSGGRVRTLHRRRAAGSAALRHRKGSIAVDGVSLTVADWTSAALDALIPQTMKDTTLGKMVRAPGQFGGRHVRQVRGVVPEP